MANNDDDDDDFSQDWEELCRAQKYDIHSTAMSQWIAMWQQVALKLLKNYAKDCGGKK
jgi:hypothetical protein